MTNHDKPRYPPPGPAHPERMRDSDYVVRGYKAALFNRSASHGANQHRESWLTAWLEDISDEDRHRTRVAGMDGQTHDPAAGRMAGEAREEKRRRESGEDAVKPSEEERNEKALQDHREE